MLESINSGKIKNKQLSYRLENRASAACTSFQRNMLLLKFGFLACSSLLSIVGLFFAAGVFFLLHLCSEKSPITVKLCHIYMIGNGRAKKICRKNFGASRKKNGGSKQNVQTSTRSTSDNFRVRLQYLRKGSRY